MKLKQGSAKIKQRDRNLKQSSTKIKPRDRKIKQSYIRIKPRDRNQKEVLRGKMIDIFVKIYYKKILLSKNI